MYIIVVLKIIPILKQNCKFCCTNINISLVFLVLYITDFLLKGEAEQLHACSFRFVRVILMRLLLIFVYCWNMQLLCQAGLSSDWHLIASQVWTRISRCSGVGHREDCKYRPTGYGGKY